MIKRRLNILADALERFKPTKQVRRFDLTAWVRSDSKCGTAACAVGFATFIPALRKLGLGRSAILRTPTYRGLWAWDAVEKFFGLSDYDAQQLFSPYHYEDDAQTTPAMVAARIRAFVATGIESV